MDSQTQWSPMRAEGTVAQGDLTEGKAAALPAEAREQRIMEHKINTLAHQEMLMWARQGIASYGQTICAEWISTIKTWYKSGHVSPKSALYPHFEVQDRKRKALIKVLNPYGKKTTKNFAELKQNESIQQGFSRND